MLQATIHYGLHFVAPLALAWLLFPRERRWHAYVVMLLTMLIDLDHLLADPIFDPKRLSVGFHLLHRWPMVALYAVMCVLPYERWRLSWRWRAVGIGLIFHIFTDLQDYYLW